MKTYWTCHHLSLVIVGSRTFNAMLYLYTNATIGLRIPQPCKYYDHYFYFCHIYGLDG